MLLVLPTMHAIYGQQIKLSLRRHLLSRISRQYYDFSRNPPITLGNDTNEFIIVYGVNHVATGKATYSNFVPYGADVWNGVGAITDSEFQWNC